LDLSYLGWIKPETILHYVPLSSHYEEVCQASSVQDCFAAFTKTYQETFTAAVFLFI
jgi:hypothetical protein